MKFFKKINKKKLLKHKLALLIVIGVVIGTSAGGYALTQNNDDNKQNEQTTSENTNDTQNSEEVLPEPLNTESEQSTQTSPQRQQAHQQAGPDPACVSQKEADLAAAQTELNTFMTSYEIAVRFYIRGEPNQTFEEALRRIQVHNPDHYNGLMAQKGRLESRVNEINIRAC